MAPRVSKYASSRPIVGQAVRQTTGGLEPMHDGEIPRSVEDRVASNFGDVRPTKEILGRFAAARAAGAAGA